MKRSFFQAAVTSILLYGCTTWTLTKRLEKKLNGNYTRMLRAILNKSWQQHPTRHQLYGHLPPITKTIQVRRTRHAGHCWRSRDELIRDVLLWIPTHGRAKAGRPARTYIQQLCEDTGCCPEDLPRAMNDREEWRERVKDIRAASTIWWWWFPSIKNNLHTHVWFQVLQSNTNNLHTRVWFQVLLLNTNNLYSLLWFQVSYLLQIISTNVYDIKYSSQIQIICTHAYCFKYSSQIQIICTQLYRFKYSYLLQINCTHVYGFKYSYLLQINCTHVYWFKYSYLLQIICTLMY